MEGNVPAGAAIQAFESTGVRMVGRMETMHTGTVNWLVIRKLQRCSMGGGGG